MAIVIAMVVVAMVMVVAMALPIDHTTAIPTMVKIMTTTLPELVRPLHLKLHTLHHRNQLIILHGFMLRLD